MSIVGWDGEATPIGMAVVVKAVLLFAALFVGLHKTVTQPTQL